MTKYYISIFLLAIVFQGCFSCHYSYKYDYGKKERERYKDISEKEFIVGVSVSRDRGKIFLDILTHSSAPAFIKDSINKVHFLEWNIYFPDGIILQRKTREGLYKTKDVYYTCDNIEKMIKKNTRLDLKIKYEVDSLGVVKLYDKKYELIRKRYCYFGVH